MKRIITIAFLSATILLGSRCSNDNDVAPRKTTNVDLKFEANGVTTIVTAKLTYSNELQRYHLVSDELNEIAAINERTQEVIYVYTLKTKAISRNGKFEIKTGYYGYAAGCFYFGTLYVGDNGQELFVQASGINAIANPPICPGGEYA